MQLQHVISTIKKNKATSILVVLQVAITFAIVSYAVLMTLSNLALWNQPTALAEKRLVSVRYQVFDPSINMGRLIEADHELLQSIEGVTGSLMTSEIPLDSLRDNVYALYISTDEDAKSHLIERFDSSDDLLKMIDAKIVEGRNFTEAEKIYGHRDSVNRTASVILVSEAFAKATFGEQSAVGKSIWQEKGGEPVQIVGVYSDFLAGEVLDNYHTMIRPIGVYALDTGVNYLLQTSVDVNEEILAQIEAALYQTTGRYVSTVEALSRPKKRMYDGRGSHSFTLLGISVMAMVITALGIGGLITFTVNQRRKTIGIRRALGGTKKQIIHFFLLEVSLLTFVGLAIGCVLLMQIAQQIIDSTGGQFSFNAMYVIALMLAVWGISLASAWVPAKRAAQIEPAIVTRG